jgi:hypothetical protein
MQIVLKDLSEPVRSHKDLDKDAVPHFQKAVKFFDGLAKQLVGQGHVLDIFASALDQVCSCLTSRFLCSSLAIMLVYYCLTLLLKTVIIGPYYVSKYGAKICFFSPSVTNKELREHTC